MTDHTDLINALSSYQQADEGGVMCLVSRQAVDEARDALEAAEAEKAAAVAAAYKRCMIIADEWEETFQKSSHYEVASGAGLVFNGIRDFATADQNDALEAMLQAEREECAQIAEAHEAKWICSQSSFGQGKASIAADIAAAIRAGGSGE